jgi:hypothetical protein
VASSGASAKRAATRVGSYTGAARCRRKFLRFFPNGFRDETYLAWERDYKVAAHERWNVLLPQVTHRRLLRSKQYEDVARAAVAIEGRTNLLFSFEKMALRDAVKSADGARGFALGLYELLYGAGSLDKKFRKWCQAVAQLPRKQTRVLTWPLVTVFGFIAQPRMHIFLKPVVTRVAATQYGFPFSYTSAPGWDTYESLHRFAAVVRRDVRDLGPRDLIDIQSFIWVQGSDEYPD